MVRGVKTGLTRSEYNSRYQYIWYRKNPERYAFYQTRARAKKLGIPFNLTLEDVKHPEVCPILGITLKRNTGGNRPLGNSPSIDKINPKLGYVKGNVQVISQRANIMKNDATVEELQRFAEWVRKTYPL